MLNLTLKQLRYADALARHGHFGHAAEASAISQPALSMQIKELEGTLGAALFERTARHVRPTPFGDAFLTRARAILRSIDDLDGLAQAARENPLIRLRLGVIPTVAPYLLPRVITALTARYPGIDLQVRETQTQTLMQDLGEGRIDCAIVALPVSEPSLTEVALLREDFVLVRPEAQAHEPVPDAEGLRKMRLLLLEEGHCFREQALSFCNTAPGLPRDGLDGSSLSTLVQMVGAGIGVTLIPEMAVPVETRSAAVTVSRFPAPCPGRQIGLVWRSAAALAAPLNDVADLLRTVLEPASQTAPAPSGQALP